MKVKELIQLLSICSEDTVVHFQFGEDDMHRLVVARMIAEQPMDAAIRESVLPMLEFLEISSIKLDMARNEVTITFNQAYITDECIEKRIIKFEKHPQRPKSE